MTCSGVSPSRQPAAVGGAAVRHAATRRRHGQRDAGAWGDVERGGVGATRAGVGDPLCVRREVADEGGKAGGKACYMLDNSCFDDCINQLAIWTSSFC